jgi:hypothetical protein
MFLNLFVIVNFGCRQDTALEDHYAVGCDAVQTSGIAKELHGAVLRAPHGIRHAF